RPDHAALDHPREPRVLGARARQGGRPARRADVRVLPRVLRGTGRRDGVAHRPRADADRLQELPPLGTPRRRGGPSHPARARGRARGPGEAAVHARGTRPVSRRRRDAPGDARHRLPRHEGEVPRPLARERDGFDPTVRRVRAPERPTLIFRRIHMPTVRPFGASVKRLEDPKYLLGRAQYVDDVKLPDTVSVAFVRSQHAHARIKSIDTSKALEMPGVLRVMTGEEAAKLCKPIRVEWG